MATGVMERTRTSHWSFSRRESLRLGGFFGAVALLHVLGWGFFLYYAHDFGRVYAGAGALAYSFGLRHAFDADHISAIDDTTRFLLQKGKRPLGVGFFFSLGHSTIVFALSLAIAVAAQAVQKHIHTFQQIGGLIGATVSGTFLWIVGILNLIVLIGIVKIWRQMKTGAYKKDELEELLLQRGFMNRILGSRFRNFISQSWQMYPVGVLFGLGFDTASEVGLLAITAAAATQATSATGAPVHIPFLGIIALPLLFAAGMSLMDTADGAFMAKAYSWAFASPVRKVFYNLTMTSLSVFVALFVGVVELMQVLIHSLDLKGGVFSAIANFDLVGRAGYFIVAAFVLAWAAAFVIYKARRIDERWAVLVDEVA